MYTVGLLIVFKEFGDMISDPHSSTPFLAAHPYSTKSVMCPVVILEMFCHSLSVEGESGDV